MEALEQIRALYEYNEWANKHVLEAAGGLSEAELTGESGASFGSIESNLAHVLAGQVVWLQRWTAGVNPKSVMELQAMRGMKTIEAAFQESHAGLRAYVSGLADGDLDRTLHYRDSGGTAHDRPMWQLLVHLVNHGTHHRAETAMAMAALKKPMRELDYHFFELERA